MTGRTERPSSVEQVGVGRGVRPGVVLQPHADVAPAPQRPLGQAAADDVGVDEFAWDPESYTAVMAEEVPDYPRLQDEVVAVVGGLAATTVLDLGVGSGLTARRVADVLPRARMVGVDDSAAMLAAAAEILDPARTELRLGRLQDPLPAGPFDLVVSVLAVHHLDDVGKADLFTRITEVLSARGSFVLADLVVPPDPDDRVTPVDGIMDTPSPLPDQLAWLRAAALEPEVRWAHGDLVVVTAGRSARHTHAREVFSREDVESWTTSTS